MLDARVGRLYSLVIEQKLLIYHIVNLPLVPCPLSLVTVHCLLFTVYCLLLCPHTSYLIPHTTYHTSEKPSYQCAEQELPTPRKTTPYKLSNQSFHLSTPQY